MAEGFVALEINGLATDGPGVKNHPSAQGTWVQSPVGELGSHMPRAAKPEPMHHERVCCARKDPTWRSGNHGPQLRPDAAKQRNKHV